MRAPSRPAVPRPEALPRRGQIHSRLVRAARLSFGLAATLAVITLWGWVLGLPRLRDFGAEFSPMPPGACIAFLLLAASFFAERRGAARMTAAAAVFATLISLFPLEGVVRDTLAPVPAVAMLLLALATPLRRDVRVLRVPVNSLIAVAAGGI